MGLALSWLWKLTDLNGWCEAVKPRLIVIQQRLMFYSGLQNHAYLIRHHIYGCVETLSYHWSFNFEQ